MRRKKGPKWSFSCYLAIDFLLWCAIISLMALKIISGGQTGADRGGLEAGLALGLPIGGFCPAGRLSEDGKVPAKYPLLEFGSNYPKRTEKNVKWADFTIILHGGKQGRGTKLTVRKCQEHGKPFYLSAIDRVDENALFEALAKHQKEHGLQIVNVAGTRESQASGIEEKVKNLLVRVFTRLTEETV